MGNVLTVTDLCKRFGRERALNSLSMRVPAGAIYGFIGRNGAGKTTLIKIVCGLLRADGGEYVLSNANNANGAGGLRIGAIAGEPAMYGDMTAAENMRAQYRILGLTGFHGIHEKLRLVGLENTGDKKAKHFSQGMRQKLGIAMALSGDPAFLILDEPVNGLDPQGIAELRELIVRLNREMGITFLISSHILSELSRVATHYGFIGHGRMLRETTAAELEQSLQKTLRMRVSSTDALARVLDARGMQYSVLSVTEADVYGNISVTQLATELIKNACEIYTCYEREEGLDEYFLRMVEDERYA